jgi:hypothetical protein
MATNWTDHENLVIISCIEQYRSDITSKSTNTVRAITKEYVKNLLDKQKLNNRTEQAVYEHLSYFDDLLAGVGTPKNYAKIVFTERGWIIERAHWANEFLLEWERLITLRRTFCIEVEEQKFYQLKGYEQPKRCPAYWEHKSLIRMEIDPELI